MKFKAKAVFASVILAAGVAFAETQATDPSVIARQDLMKVFGGSAKVLGGMAGGKVAFDAAAAQAAKDALIVASADITAKFEINAADAGSESKPEVWTNWEDFAAKAKALNDAALAIDVTSVEGIQAGMGAIGGSCKSCHTAYRM